VPFRPLPPHVDLPALEQRVGERWRASRVFERSLAQTADGEPYVVYEGPPTANGHPGTHHVEARVFKDLFPRYQTMRGRSVPRRGGWDCHGLPVELAVEKELGFTGKGDIEAYGVAEFNARCRESVLRHVDEFERMTERMGYWLDLGAAYQTMDTSYVESVWWSLAQLHDRGMLVEDHRVTPYCPRCQTGLSDHEVAQGYAEVVDPSVWFRVHLTGGPLHDRLDGQPADLLVWTTQPWTAYVNTAVAVHPEVTYLAVRAASGEVLVVAENLVSAAVGEGAVELARVRGAELEHSSYAPLYAVPGLSDERRVLLADYVTTDAGTGLVGQSPAFGAEDMATARRYGLAVVNPVGRDGRFDAGLPLVGGVGVKAADRLVIDDLAARGQLWREEAYPHQFPLCWRCDTPLLYYALPSWYLRTTEHREQMLAQNAGTDWHPATTRDGRYGEWLRGNVDWALSRSRYWGTPLPLWRCDDDPAHVTAVESLAHLSTLSGTDQSGLDPHRPYVDAVTLPCPVPAERGTPCGGVARRVPEVIDAWYDSGAMPFAQFGYPHVPGSVEAFEAAHPADMICEALDQTRGWFYTLMAVGTLVQGVSPYRTVLCLGIILDDGGRKMSKHLGNVLDPFELFDRHGADAVRWLMLAGGNPWQPRRVGHEAVAEVVRTVLLTYWNTVSFFTTYAHAAGWSPPERSASVGTVLDGWLTAELRDATREVTDALDAYDSPRAGRRLQRFLDDLSNWYVRRSRRRFWDSDTAALTTLWSALLQLTQLLAPFVPFVTDEVWAALDGPDSVHLAPWPQAAPLEDETQALRAEVAVIRRLVELGRGARASSGAKTRQPLARALVSGADGIRPELLRELADELNVVSVESLSSAGELVDVAVKPNFRLLGKRFGNRTKEVAAQFATAAYDGAVVRVSLDDVEHVLSGDELLVTETPREGWAVASAEGLSVALDLALTPELRLAGLLRDAVRLVQDGRKAAGLQVSDRIELWWQAGGELAEALRGRSSALAAEVLAVSVVEGAPSADLAPRVDDDSGLTFWLRAAGE